MAAPSMKGIFDDAPAPDEEMKEPMSEESDSEYPPEYMAAYDEYASSPSAETFWRAVEACTEAGKGGGLALLIGPKGKGKK